MTSTLLTSRRRSLGVGHLPLVAATLAHAGLIALLASTQARPVLSRPPARGVLVQLVGEMPRTRGTPPSSSLSARLDAFHQSQSTPGSSPSPSPPVPSTRLSDLFDRARPGRADDARPAEPGADILAAKVSHSREELGAGLSAQSQACWRGAAPSAPVRVRAVLDARGRVTGDPQVLAEMTTTEDRRRAIQAVRLCAPYTRGDGTAPGAFEFLFN